MPFDGGAVRPRDHRAVMAARREPAVSPDFAPTAPWGGRAVCEIVRRLDPGARTCREPAAGAGHLAHGLRRSADFPLGFEAVLESDLYDYGRGAPCLDWTDAAAVDPHPPCDWVITNPPFGPLVAPFVRRSLARARRGVALLLQTTRIAGQGRSALFAETELTVFAPFAERMALSMDRWEADGSTATDYAWFVWLRPEAARASPLRRALAACRTAGGRLQLEVPPGSRARLTRASDAAFACGAVSGGGAG